MKNTILGYKVLNGDGSTQYGKTYKIGHSYIEDLTPEVKYSGMHFAQTLAKLFTVYSHLDGKKVVQVLAFGDVDVGRHLMSTNAMTIIQELTWDDIMDTLVDEGVENWKEMHVDFHSLEMDDNHVIHSKTNPVGKESQLSELTRTLSMIANHDKVLSKALSDWIEQLQKEQESITETFDNTGAKPWNELSEAQKIYFQTKHPEINKWNLSGIYVDGDDLL